MTENPVSKLPNPSNNYGVLSVAQYYSHLGLTKKFNLLPTEKDYVLKILRDIGTSKAAGIDRLPGRFLKDGADVLAKPVTDIRNLSISLNKFPRAFKLAKAKPIFKKGRKTNVSSYRPISLLPILSKVIEKVVHEQTTKFSNDNNIFYKYQSGFRSRPIDLVLSFLTDKILKSFDNGMYTGMILIDLQKAFDAINHEILLNKLLPIDFSKNTISWYESYLVERHFTVEVANRVSKFANILCGVPQGSILGPLLFLIYFDDMSQAVECNLYLYADDSCLLFQHKSVTEIKKKQLTEDVSNTCDWFVDNKVSIHFGEDKTNSLLFSSKRNLKLVEELDIRYKEIKIKQHKHVNYLGCVLNETMSGKTMVFRVIEKSTLG